MLTKNQIKEIKKFGMIPVRRDILGKSSIGFKESWKTDVFNVSLKQIRLNKKNRLPYSKSLDDLEKQYFQVWNQVVTASSEGYLGEEKILKIQNSQK